MLCYENVVLLLNVTVKILYFECCVMKTLFYCSVLLLRFYISNVVL